MTNNQLRCYTSTGRHWRYNTQGIVIISNTVNALYIVHLPEALLMSNLWNGRVDVSKIFNTCKEDTRGPNNYWAFIKFVPTHVHIGHSLFLPSCNLKDISLYIHQ